jgi:hypothetical protein
METIAGFAVSVRSIQYNRTAVLLPGCGDLGHSLRLAVREVQILALKLRFQPRRRLCGLDQRPHQVVALLGDRTQSLLAARAVF